MKGAIIAVITVLVAVAAATESENHDKPAGSCPPINGVTPVYLMDEINRTVFYECNWGNPVRQKCPAGLVFDPRMKVCNFPSRECEAFGPVGTCPREDETFLKQLRDGSNTSVFYICVDGQPMKYQCEDGLVFNPVLQACFVSA